MYPKASNTIHASASTVVPRFRLQYASNLYITRHEKPLFPLFLQPTAPHLAIVGNVGHPLSDYYSSFFTWVASRWHTIIYVPGDVEHSTTVNIYDVLKHHSNVHILTEKNPFFIYEYKKVALWTPVQEKGCLYRKLFAFTYDCENHRTVLAHHATIHSHGINSTNNKTYINSRGYNEQPAEGYSTTAVVNILS